MNTCGLLLAAGASRRFGVEDKLLAPLKGRPLIAHAAKAMRHARLDNRIAVIADPAMEPHLEGFRTILIAPGQQSDSLRAGLNAAASCDRLLIVLGDMPWITTAHLDRVVALARDDRPSASRADDGRVLPPACFPRSSFADLAVLRGDQGAGRLIAPLPPDALVEASVLLDDIDTPADLQAAGMARD